MNLRSFPKHYQTSTNEHELPKDDVNINAKRPSVRNKKAGAFSSEKHPEVHKSLSQGTPCPRKRKEVLFNHSFN